MAFTLPYGPTRSPKVSAIGGGGAGASENGQHVATVELHTPIDATGSVHQLDLPGFVLELRLALFSNGEADIGMDHHGLS
jgi:hypothetical protein